MNEVLKEIAVEAQVEHCISHVRLKEFAELIVQECVETLGTYEETWTHEKQMKLLKEHFGVEE